MSVYDAKPNDLYVDRQGKLWRVVGRWDTPVISMKAVEPDSSPHNGVPPEMDSRLGGVNGVMWDGFTRVWRKE